MMVVPPNELSTRSRGPVEMVFVVDCSGSMSGYPLDKAKTCIDRSLTQLREGDSFQIIRFASSAAKFADAPQSATPDNVRRGREWLAHLTPGGGTYMIEGVKAALSYPHDPRRERVVCFMTDGYIGNEGEILTEIRRGLGPTHIFSFGVGSSVNRYLMDSMARVGRGAVAYVGPNDDVADAMDPFFDRVTRASLTDVSIDWGAQGACDVYPRRLPDLYVGRPVMVVGRLSERPSGSARVRGSVKSSDGPHDADSIIAWPAASRSSGALAQIWARGRLAELAENEFGAPDPEIRDAILSTALSFNLVSSRTAFVAVDSLSHTQGDHGTTVAVPVPVPEGVRYDTTVRSEK
jgi:Ca-activated chloride channel family protein